MILLKANQELKQTFEKLIQTMQVPVQWNGLFVIVDNYIILQGELRSLFFHFDSRKVVTNIIELTIKEEEIQQIGDNEKLRNSINMILYAFGKWGNIKGLRVEKDYGQLNQLFSQVLGAFDVEPQYNQEHFQFYKEGIRITYEDVIQLAIEAKEKEPELKEAEQGGLWHKIVWKKMLNVFTVVETTLTERQQARIGNNFYLVGYLCPACKEKLHMVVYPVMKEFRIETEEGAVKLARAYTCPNCCVFYTPRPKKLIAEGDVYIMDFQKDERAYEDYQELLGRNGERVSNYNYNEFLHKQANQEESAQEAGQEEAGQVSEDDNQEVSDRMVAEIKQQQDLADETLMENCQQLDEVSDAEFRQLLHKVEDGFYSDACIKKVEKKVKEQSKTRRDKDDKKREDQTAVKGDGKESAPNAAGESKKQGAVPANNVSDDNSATAHHNVPDNNTASANNNVPDNNTASENNSASEGNNPSESKCATESNQASDTASEEKYSAKIQLLPRLSERQRAELKIQIKNDKKINDGVRANLLSQVDTAEQQEKETKLRQKVENSRGKNYVVLQRVYEEVEGTQLPAQKKQELLQELNQLKKQQGEKEVKQFMEQMPRELDRKTYKLYLQKLKSYPEVDTSAYENQLVEKAARVEENEINAIIKRARKNTREDLASLTAFLSDQDFLPEIVEPYIDKIHDRIMELDQKVMDEICGNTATMTFEEAESAYEKIEQGPFLPELKTNALQMLEKRLSKIKTDECELLVQKLQSMMEEQKLPQNQRSYYYPARKVLLKQAKPEETEVINFAKASYAAGIQKFEYPIWVVDTSRNKSGKEGMILTPENIFYSNLLTSYHISIFSIKEIKATTGLLNRGLYAYQKNGTKTKLPYTVETQQLPKLAAALNQFIHYLQEKPVSRKETYLAKEKHDTICCFRCGYVYKGGNTCPKCGYKMNE